ncbi:MAG: nitroreductase family protein [Desulfobacterales bacterium]|nr:nitroreductase family protein [Desulfobacterales bacterium]
MDEELAKRPPNERLHTDACICMEQGHDVICRGAPHLLFAHIPESNPIASVDAIIALTHFDLAAPAFGIGTCWAGFVTMAAVSYEPLQKELGLRQAGDVLTG